MSSPEKLYHSAVRMLAGREHSRRELGDKLKRKFKSVPDRDINNALDALVADGLQSDERYLESLVRSRISRGYGPIYIQQEMRQKGVEGISLDELEPWLEANWLEIAQDIVERRFSEAETDGAIWMKATRYLQRRGFTTDVCIRALPERP